MNRRVAWSKGAAKALVRLDRPTQKRNLAAIDQLAETHRGDVRRLEGSPKEAYRLRVGGWRVIFSYLDDTTLLILKIGARGDVYKS